MSRTRIVFLHGVATTSRVWRHLAPAFADFDVLCPDRPASGDLDIEIAALEQVSRGAVVVGVSGGATLGLELASRGTPMLAGVFHEPAAGSLAPGLLAHVGDGLRDSGVAGFGRALYGPSWLIEEAGGADLTVVAREFAMFSGFEPTPVAATAGPILLTTGEHSPAARLASVEAVARRLQLSWTVVPGGSHAVHLEAPAEFAAVVRRHVEGVLAQRASR